MRYMNDFDRYKSYDENEDFYDAQYIKNYIIKSFSNEIIKLSSDEYVNSEIKPTEIKFRKSFLVIKEYNKKILLYNFIEKFTNELVITIYNDLIKSTSIINSRGIKYTPMVNFSNMSDFLKFIQSFKENMTFDKYKKIKTNKDYDFLGRYFLFGINYHRNNGLYKFIYNSFLDERLYDKYKSPYQHHKSYDVDNILFINYEKNDEKIEPHLFLINNFYKFLYDVKIKSLETEYDVHTGFYHIHIDMSYSKINSPAFSFNLS